MNKEEQIKTLIKDIQNLKEKLLFVTSKKISPNIRADGEDANFITKIKEERTIRNRLKDKIETYNKIKEAEKINKEERG